VPSDQQEPNRILGLPRRPYPGAGRTEEPQRVLGLPLDSYGLVDFDRLQRLAHPIKAYKRWMQHRRLGPYAPDEDEDEPKPAG
jgi:hypothetical protein